MWRNSKQMVIGFILLSVAVTVALDEAVAQYEITRKTIDGGGVMRSMGGPYELSGTIGQPDGGPLSGGDLTLSGGFWFPIPLGDCDDDGDVDLSDYARLVAQAKGCLAGPGGSAPLGVCRCFDVNASGEVDLADFAVIQSTHTGS